MIGALIMAAIVALVTVISKPWEKYRKKDKKPREN